MPNYYLDQYNLFLQNANQIHSFLTGNYMNGYEGRLLDCTEFTDCIDGMKLVELASFRKTSSEKELFDNFKAVIATALSSFHRCSCSVGYFIVSDYNKIGLYFGSEVVNTTSFEMILKGNLADAEIIYNDFAADKLKKYAAYGGVVTGAADITESRIDLLLDELNGKNAVIAIIARPFDRYESETYGLALSNLYDMSCAFDRVEETYGNSSRVSIQSRFENLNPLKDHLKAQSDRIHKNQNDLWKAAIWFGSDKRDNAYALGGRLAGVLSTAAENVIEKGRFFMTSTNPLQQKKLAISHDQFDSLEYPLDGSLRKGSLYSVVTTTELASMFQIPARSHVGINVVDYSDDAATFSTNPPSVSGSSFVLGTEIETKQPYRLSLNDFAEHMLITGGPGGGKTNTVMTILGNLYEKGVPFCVLEPSKKEYWKIVGDINNLKIYSCGSDALQLTVNPFEPEEGIVIGNHINDLMHAFYGAFDMEEPTRLSLEGLVNYVYKKLGWSLDEIAFDKGKRYPVVQDLIDHLPGYSAEENKSGDEVKKNIEGAILRRLVSVSSGTIASVTSSGKNITGGELCSGSVLIELDDLSLDLKPFITNLLLIKMNQYLRQRDSGHNLKNVIVVEEAHNVFSRISDNGVRKTSKDISSEYFSNMLSEIRALGTGIIVVDQGASKINSAAVAHTKIKIMHAVTDENDVNAESFALGLNNSRRNLLPTFKTGEALVAVRGQTNVCKVHVNKNALNNFDNFGCIFCKHRRFCDKDEITRKIADDQRGCIMLSKVVSCRFDNNSIRNHVDSYLRQFNISDNLYSCAFGYMMAHNRMECSDREKRKLLFRYLKG